MKIKDRHRVVLKSSLERLLYAVTSKFPRHIMWSGEPDQVRELYAAIDEAKETLKIKEKKCPRENAK